jgi:tetratricopeptide (TPR) repeat protein
VKVRRPKRIKANYRSALRIDPDLAPAANNLAMIKLRSGGNLDEALELARRAVAASPEVPHFHDTLGRVYRARGDRVAAIASLEKATSLPPPQADIWYHLGQLYDEDGREAQAIKSYRRALEVDAGFADAAAARARIETLNQ